ncbi:DUF6514 family protein [Eubacterium multiforme]|uniref:Uncharacterized protein n=1 Tax=Eubacterium multiforme TaxID=83339 RepID=A0ABT9UWS7_9FIRM|nr:DUF6514 family protein [Eubacterium multiforme]MDQ0150766.1 hypothetical protein [Eubacterium multiforme]
MNKENFEFLRTTNGIQRKYEYKLTKILIGKDEIFGVEVERIDYKGDLVIDSFKDSVELISPIKEKVINLLKMLYENQVSPIHLIDIIGPFVDEYVNDFKDVQFDDLSVMRA